LGVYSQANTAFEVGKRTVIYVSKKMLETKPIWRHAPYGLFIPTETAWKLFKKKKRLKWKCTF
jgi:hypothetical protein